MSSSVFSVDLSGLLTFAAAYAAMLVTPGPSFAVVSEASLSGSRQAAALVVIGVACGASLLIMFVLGGTASLPVYEYSDQVGRYAGTVLLLIVGFRACRRSWRSAGSVLSRKRRPTFGGHFVVGLVTAFTNPISLAFFSSIALASRSTELVLHQFMMPIGVFLMALCWFGLLAMLLSLPPVKSMCGRATRRVDAIVGAILITVALAWIVVPR